MATAELIFMIRNGGFGTNFEIKFFMIVAAFVFCIYDFKKNKRLDYFYIFLVGTLIWGTVELSLVLNGTRDFNDVSLFEIQLPAIVSAYIRGASEGAVIALIGIGFGDRFIPKKNRNRTAIYFLFFMGLIAWSIFSGNPSMRDIGGEVASRRAVFTLVSVSFLAISTLFSLVWYFKLENSRMKKRALFMFLTLVLFATVWTVFEVVANARWVEIGSEGSYTRAPVAIEFLVLAYDVVIEIGFCYMPYLAIPSLCGWISNKAKQNG